MISAHALKQARKRGITPDMVEAAVRGGKIVRFGKNYLKLAMNYKRGRLICIGALVGESIIIKTVEWGN